MVDAISEVLAASNVTASPDSYRVVSATYGDVIRVTPDRLLGSAPLDVEVTIDPVKHMTASPDSCCVVSATYGDVIRVTPDRLLGSAPLDVEVTIDRVKHMQTEVARLDMEAMTHRKCIVAVARAPLRSLAAQVLMMALGLATLEQTQSMRVQSLPPDNPVIVKLAQMASNKPEELQVQLDNLITRRNNDGGHLTTLTALENEVESLRDLLEIPEIKQRCKWEAWVVEHYDDIKEAFPSQFQSKGQQA